MIDVTALGELLIDFNMDGVNEDGYPVMSAHPGGAPGNYLAALAKRGLRTSYITKVGDDAFGAMLKETIRKVGIDVSGIVTAPDTFTTLAFVTLDEQGDREFSFARKPGADTRLAPEEIPAELIENSRVFHFGTLSLTDEPARSATHKAVELARKAGCLISVDPNLRLPLWKKPEDAKEQMLWAISQADVLKISDDEVEFLFGMTPEEGAEHLFRTYSNSLIFVTLGKDGAYFKNRNACGHVPNFEGIQAIDTCGAGDIFGGSAMAALLKTGKKPEDLNKDELTAITSYACAAASLSTTRHGGIGSVPETADVEKLLAQR